MRSHKRHQIIIVAVMAIAINLVTATSATADPPPGAVPIDYDLSTLSLRNAVYNPGPGTITATAKKAKALLPAMAAAGPGGRYLEIDITAEAASAQVLATWYEGTQFRFSDKVQVPGGERHTILLDLSTMLDTTGVVRLRIDGSDGGGSTIHRIGLYDIDQSEDDRPNIVFILVDDMRADDAEMGFYRSLPETSTLETELIDKGTTFKNFFNATPLCCPARASYLTGQYNHNNKVYGNNGAVLPDQNGGILRFYLDGRDETSLGTWMQEAGYETALVGKYLNGYPNRQGLSSMGVTEEYVPNGWDEWYGSFLHDNDRVGPFNFSFDHFRFNENGTVVEYGPGSYLTDVESDLAVDFIDRNAGNSPFFLYLAPYAPHAPTQPRPDHLGRHEAAGVEPIRAPSCGEADLSDKPQWVQDIDGLRNYGRCWGKGWQKKLDMTLALDELIADVLAELEEEGVLDNTYVIFTSDNGQLRGEHQLSGKSAPYEESIRVPLIVRGPNVAAGVTKPHLTLNIDMAPTFLEIAEAGPTAESPPIDGESLIGPLMGMVGPDDWRDAVLVELRTPTESFKQPHRVPRYFGVRTADHLYVEYEDGDKELYDLVADPFQIDSIHDSADPALLAELAAFVAALDACIGAECAEAARAPEIVPSLHVHDIAVTTKVAKSRGIVKVTVVDDSADAVSAAGVTGDWYVGGTLFETTTAVSAVNGKAKFSFVVAGPTSGLELKLCVTGIAHADLEYAPEDNVEDCDLTLWP